MRKIKVMAVLGAIFLWICSTVPVDASSPGENKMNQSAKTSAPGKSDRLAKGHTEFGLELGYGFNHDIPSGAERTDLEWVFFAPNFRYDLTGNIGKSFYQGNLNWFVDFELSELFEPQDGVTFGFVPLMVEYKFAKPGRTIIPKWFGGAGFSYTDWNKFARELGGHFQFILETGAGVEFLQTEIGNFSFNYRFYHLSNSGLDDSNIGINASIFTLGVSF